jgi:hypothetical protein
MWRDMLQAAFKNQYRFDMRVSAEHMTATILFMPPRAAPPPETRAAATLPQVTIIRHTAIRLTLLFEMC